MTKISVIMGVWNEEVNIVESVKSILNQDFKDFEFIIIDDGSTDKSYKKLLKLAKEDARILLKKNKKNIGLTKTLNIALDISKGKYIARHDGDDISIKDRLSIQYKYLENHSDVYLVGGNSSIIRNDREISASGYITDEAELAKELPYNNAIYHSVIMFRNDGHRYRDKFLYAQDYDFYLVLLREGKRLINLPSILMKYRLVENSSSHLQSWKQRVFGEKAKELYQQYLKEGKDDYSKFNPDEILNIDVDTSIDPILLKTEIEANFRVNNFNRAKQFMKRYFKHHGYFNKYILYYLLTLIGKTNMNRLRKWLRG